MRYAICNETFQDWPFPRAFRFARECGYTGIEFAPFTIQKNAYDITMAERHSVRRLAETENLEVVGLHWLLAFTRGYYLTSPDEDVRRETAAYIGELARLCRDLGGTILVLGSPKQRNVLPGLTHEQAMRFAADVLRRTCGTLGDCKVRLAVEPLGPEEGDFLRTADLAAELIEMVDCPHVGLHLDVKAMASESTPIVDILRRHAGSALHFHANDANRRGPGMGTVDFEPILATLRDMGYSGWISVEVFDFAPGVESLARDSIAYLKRCEERVERRSIGHES
ncbi:MAG: sugar phosphate isomerase/epimerase [Planctomycetes bacterium]|nr:sugar phosphate isomerase/epimerase [Planctomycetota bacterium]